MNKTNPKYRNEIIRLYTKVNYIIIYTNDKICLNPTNMHLYAKLNLINEIGLI